MTIRPINYPNIEIPEYSIIRTTYNSRLYEFIERENDYLVVCDIKTGKIEHIPDTMEITIIME